MDLNQIYKQGNTFSHEEGLRLVYEKGRYDASNSIQDQVQAPTVADLSINPVETPTQTLQAVDAEVVNEQPSTDTPLVPV